MKNILLAFYILIAMSTLSSQSHATVNVGVNLNFFTNSRTGLPTMKNFIKSPMYIQEFGKELPDTFSDGISSGSSIRHTDADRIKICINPNEDLKVYMYSNKNIATYNAKFPGALSIGTSLHEADDPHSVIKESKHGGSLRNYLDKPNFSEVNMDDFLLVGIENLGLGKDITKKYYSWLAAAGHWEKTYFSMAMLFVQNGNVVSYSVRWHSKEADLSRIFLGLVQLVNSEEDPLCSK